MTTEDDFQKALDACPEDWQTRLVFADWLQERGDPRAEGYRALGVLARTPNRMQLERVRSPDLVHWWFHCQCSETSLHDAPSHLPREWFAALAGREPDPTRANNGDWFYPQDSVNNTRAEVEDAAALAFSRLPPERRAELLTAAVG